MRIITLDANGIRSAKLKGFFTGTQQQDADIICIQEAKCQPDNLALIFFPSSYHCLAMMLKKVIAEKMLYIARKSPIESSTTWTGKKSIGKAALLALRLTK